MSLGEPVPWLEVPEHDGSGTFGRLTAPPGIYARVVDLLAWLDAYPESTAGDAARVLAALLEVAP